MWYLVQVLWDLALCVVGISVIGPDKSVVTWVIYESVVSAGRNYQACRARGDAQYDDRNDA